MKEPKWNDAANDSKEYPVMLTDDDEGDGDVDVDVDGEEGELDDEPVGRLAAKTHFTELRRRIEERLDSKRIDHEFDYDDELDTPLDELG